MIERVISGGQTGADQAGLAAAKQLGIPTGGYMPRGWLTEDGSRPEFEKEYGMEETVSYQGYRTRTLWNVREADATLVFGDDLSPGSRLTITHCKERKKPFLVVPYPTAFSVETTAKVVGAWLMATQPRTLNIAGNRESTNPGIFNFTKSVLLEILGVEPHCNNPECYKPPFPF